MKIMQLARLTNQWVYVGWNEKARLNQGGCSNDVCRWSLRGDVWIWSLMGDVWRRSSTGDVWRWSPTVTYGDGAPRVKCADAAPRVTYGDGAPRVKYGNGAPRVACGDAASRVTYGDGAPWMTYGDIAPRVMYEDGPHGWCLKKYTLHWPCHMSHFIHNRVHDSAQGFVINSKGSTDYYWHRVNNTGSVINSTSCMFFTDPMLIFVRLRSIIMTS